MKNYLKVSAILGLIVCICALLIGVMNVLTKDTIKANNQKVVNETYGVVLDNYDGTVTYKVDDTFVAEGYLLSKAEVLDSSNNVVGYIYTTSGSNSYGSVSLMVGVVLDGTEYKVLDVELLSNTESFASTLNSHVKSSYPSAPDSKVVISPYGSEEAAKVGALTKSQVTSMDLVCGATYGATLVNNMVKAVLADLA